VVSVSLLGLLVVYALLTVFFLIYVARFLRKGPDLTLEPPVPLSPRGRGR
jgi:cytochrome bd-type quinol oxidase subunit 1